MANLNPDRYVDESAINGWPAQRYDEATRRAFRALMDARERAEAREQRTMLWACLILDQKGPVEIPLRDINGVTAGPHRGEVCRQDRPDKDIALFWFRRA